jgi:hypothetical protein
MYHSSNRNSHACCINFETKNRSTVLVLIQPYRYHSAFAVYAYKLIIYMNISLWCSILHTASIRTYVYSNTRVHTYGLIKHDARTVYLYDTWCVMYVSPPDSRGAPEHRRI